MENKRTEILFRSRGDFREWLSKNSETSLGVWLIFTKTKNLVSLTAHEALEEALCFGWIDGKIKSIDESRYIKYFSKRQKKSIWSEKNIKLVASLEERGLMEEEGRLAVLTAKANGMWEATYGKPITSVHVEEFTNLLLGIEPAYTNFMNMSKSIKTTYTRRYHSFKTEEARRRDFQRIIERLNQNLKPM